MAQRRTPGRARRFDDEGTEQYAAKMARGQEMAAERTARVRNQEVDAFGLPTTRLERDRRKKQVTADVMEGYKMSPQGQAAEALAKKRRNTPMFAIDARGEGVGELQEFLKKGGFYKGGIDNDFGDQTKAAVEAYQRSKGLTADGMVGTNTMDAIKADMAGGSPAAAPAAPKPAVAATESRAGRMTPGAQLRKIRAGSSNLTESDLPRERPEVIESLVDEGLIDMDLAASRGYRPDISREPKIPSDLDYPKKLGGKGAARGGDMVRDMGSMAGKGAARVQDLVEVVGDKVFGARDMAEEGASSARDMADKGVSRARDMAEEGASSARDIYQREKARVEAEALRGRNAANQGARKLASDAETLSEEAVSLGKQSMADAAENLRNMGEAAQQELINRGVVTEDQLNTILRYF
jgi:hypothetical protein